MQATLTEAGTLVNRPIDESVCADKAGLTTKVSQSFTFVCSSAARRWLGAIQMSHSFGFWSEGRLVGAGERW